MKLYLHLDRIERRLKAAAEGSSPLSVDLAPAQRPIDPELLGKVDGLHFFGDEPLVKIRRLIEKAGGDRAHVLDLGTGYGGSARLLAHRTGCRVDALELQPDLSAVAQELTRRCGLEDRVAHLTGDFLLRPVSLEKYDVVVGLLSFLHIGQWRELFTRCFQSLKPGGVIYVEDFFRRGDSFSQEELRLLKEDIHCADLISRSEMTGLLEEIGFDSVDFQDATKKWIPYVTARTETFEAELDKHIEEDGEDVARALNHFYASVAKVFNMGNLGGYMLCARRPLQ